jgi:hypothetical protein
MKEIKLIYPVFLVTFSIISSERPLMPTGVLYGGDKRCKQDFGGKT